MKKVLIVSYYFAPGSTIGAKRYGIMCKYFAENGYDPYIVTTPVSTTYLGSKFDLPIPVSSEKIIRVPIGQAGKSFVPFIINWFDKLKLDSRTVTSSLLWYRNIKKLIDLEQLEDIDIVIGTYGPIGNIYAAKYLAKRLNCKYIADMRDLISDSKTTSEGYKRTFKLDRLIEMWLLRSSDAIVTISPEITRAMQKRYPGKETSTIYNGWDGNKEKYIKKPEEKYLYYAGSLYEERLGCLLILLRALKIANEKEKIRMVIRSIGPKQLDVKAKNIIRNMRMQNIVEYLPGSDERVVKEECQKAYINVVLNSIYEDEIETMAAIPGKTYELIHEETPVLAISPENSRVARLLTYTKKGIGTVDESKIVDFILSAEGKCGGNDNVSKFSRAHQAKRLCQFMDQVLKY